MVIAKKAMRALIKAGIIWMLIFCLLTHNPPRPGKFIFINESDMVVYNLEMDYHWTLRERLSPLEPGEQVEYVMRDPPIGEGSLVLNYMVNDESRSHTLYGYLTPGAFDGDTCTYTFDSDGLLVHIPDDDCRP